MVEIQLTERQAKIVSYVKLTGPVTSEDIAGQLHVTRATLRPDLAILTMSGILEARPRVGYYFSGKSPRFLVAEEIRKIRVRDIKSVPVVISVQTSVYDAVVTLFVEDVGNLFVVDAGGVLEGVVSRKDLLKSSLGMGDLHQIPVSVVMTRMPNLITTTMDETVLMAAQKLIEHEVDALPVVRTFLNEKGEERLEVIGRLTKTNITKLFVELGEGK